MKTKVWKKFLITAAMLCMGAATLGASACKDKDDDVGTITLVNFEDETLEVGYGAMYDLELMVTDSEGNLHAVIGNVKTTDGTPVQTLNGKFVVHDRSGYVITYSFASGNTTVTRTVTLTVKALKKPIISLTGNVSVVMLGDACVLPTAEAYDYYDGDVEVTTEVYKKGKETDVKMEYDVQAGTFTATEAGDYYVLYTASNSADAKQTETVDFYVRKQVFLGDENTPKAVVPATLNTVYNNDIAGKFVENGAGSVLADFVGEYTGNAVRLNLSSNPGYNYKNPYTAEELASFVEKYNTVSFWMATTDVAEGEARLYHQGNTPYTFGGIVAQEGAVVITPDMMGKWLKLSISMKDYIMLLEQTNFDYCNLFKCYLSGVKIPDLNNNGNLTDDKASCYIGDMEFSYEPPTVVKVDESAGLKIKKGNYGGKYVANEAGSAINGFTGDYEGDAIAFLDARSKDYRVSNIYTLEQLEILKTKYTHVSMWIAMDNIGTTGYFQMHANPASGARQSFLNKVYSNNASSIATFNNASNNKWFKYSISIDDYISLLTTTVTDAETGEETVTVHDYILIANPNVSGSTTSITDVNGDGICNYQDVTLYVGDVFFETLA